MRMIEIDASRCKDAIDLIDEIRAAIDVPHMGASIDALLDAMVWGGMGGVEAPYVIRLTGLGEGEAKAFAETLSAYLVEARAEHRARRGTDVEVSLEII